MSFLLAEPQVMAAAAAELEGIGSALGAASAAAAGPTSTVLAAAGDEVSAAIADLFGGYGQEYQVLLRRVSVFQNQFQQSLAAAGNAYVQAEAAGAAALQGALGVPGAQAAAPAATLPPFSANPVQLIFGGTGVPIPPQKLIDGAENLYIRAGALLNPLGINTPEQLYPLTGIRSLYFNQSVDQGLTIMHDSIMSQIAAGNAVTVSGVSQSAVMASLEMRNLAAMGAGAPTAAQLNFVLTGNEMNPNGGLLARFPGLSMPSLGLEFYGSTPSDTIYPTANYTLEYDGFADFPRYPLNLLADLNAVAGIVFVHPTYYSIPIEQVNNAIQLPTSPGYYENGGVTHYYMIPTEHLPLLQPLRALPVIGNPLANLIEPNMRVLVNLGYGDPNYGYSTSYADVPTPFGLFPDVPPQVIADALVAGTQQGISDFSRDMQTLAANPPGLPTFGPPSAADLMTTAASFPSPAKIVNVAASIISTDYALLLPAADIGLGMVTSIPVYNAQLFVEQLAQGNLLNAIGYPIAADVGIGTVAGAVYGLTVIEALASNIKDIQSLAA
jgi:hypothetical protein